MNRDDEAYLFFKVSCTRDEAVGMLLGWMQGFTRPAAINLDNHGTIPEDQLPLLQSLDQPLIDYITDLRNAAYENFEVLYESEGTFEKELDEQAAVVDRYNLLAKNAWGYLMDITDEIAKGDASALRIDHAESARSGTPHYTLRSVDAWARGKFGISIFKDQKLDQEDDQENRKDAIIKNYTKPEIGLSKTRTNGFYTTFALLIDMHSENSPLFKHGNNPNVEQIAIAINKFGKKSNNDQTIEGQSVEAMKSRIEDAMKHKKATLPPSE